MVGKKGKCCNCLIHFSLSTCHCVKRPSEEIKPSTWSSISRVLTWSLSCSTTKSRSSHRKIWRWSRSSRDASFTPSVWTLRCTGLKMREELVQALTKFVYAQQTTNCSSTSWTSPRTRFYSKRIAESLNPKATKLGSNLPSCFGTGKEFTWQANALTWWWARKTALPSSSTRLITKVR